MPTYAYRCRSCAQMSEAFEKMTATRRTKKCAACGGRAERVISGGAGFLFKGGGFYITDYRSEAYRTKADKEKAAEGPTAEAKADAKSEAKADAKSVAKAEGESQPADVPAAGKSAGPKAGKKGKKGGRQE